jgi:hypothetical protein
MGSPMPTEPLMITTDLHKIELGASAMRVVGSGSIEGYLGSDIDKAAFRLSEYNGQLRAVSSSSGMWVGTKNRLTVIEPSTTTPGLLRTVSVLPNAQRPEAIGKPAEQLYATRFLDDRLYAVTSGMSIRSMSSTSPADPIRKSRAPWSCPGFPITCIRCRAGSCSASARTPALSA